MAKTNLFAKGEWLFYRKLISSHLLVFFCELEAVSPALSNHFSYPLFHLFRMKLSSYRFSYFTPLCETLSLFDQH